MTRSTGQRKTRSDKGIKRSAKATTAPRTQEPKDNAIVPSFITVTEEQGETVYSLSLSDAIPLIKHGVSIEDKTDACFTSRPEFCCGDKSLTPTLCLDMLENGWTTDRPTLDLPMGDVAFTQAFAMDTQGCYPDVAEYLSGSPECMVDFVMSPSAPRFLHLVVNTTITAEVSNAKLFARGKYILSVIDSLESQGIRVKLTVCDSNSRWERHSTVALTIKDYQDPLDEALICYVLGHPSFFRLCQFALADALYDKYNIRHGLMVREHSRGSCNNTYAFPSSADTLSLPYGLKHEWENSVNRWLAEHKQ